MQPTTFCGTVMLLLGTCESTFGQARGGAGGIGAAGGGRGGPGVGVSGGGASASGNSFFAPSGLNSWSGFGAPRASIASRHERTPGSSPCPECVPDPRQWFAPH